MRSSRSLETSLKPVFHLKFHSPWTTHQAPTVSLITSLQQACGQTPCGQEEVIDVDIQILVLPNTSHCHVKSAALVCTYYVSYFVRCCISPNDTPATQKLLDGIISSALPHSKKHLILKIGSPMQMTSTFTRSVIYTELNLVTLLPCIRMYGHRAGGYKRATGTAV